MNELKRRVAAGLFVFTVAVLAACGGDSVTNPAFEPEIVNLPDSFELQATDITDVSETLVYTWQNSGTTASVDRSSVLVSGSGTVTVYDADGKQVFTSAVTTDGSSTTDSGVSGAWQIRVVLSDASGTINFRVQKG